MPTVYLTKRGTKRFLSSPQIGDRPRFTSARPLPPAAAFLVCLHGRGARKTGSDPIFSNHCAPKSRLQKVSLLLLFWHGQHRENTRADEDESWWGSIQRAEKGLRALFREASPKWQQSLRIQNAMAW
jgi:hypothetical protein